MPTFVTNPRMNPALAARILASVRGRRVTASRSKPRLMVVLRLVVVVAVIALVGVFVVLRQRIRSESEGMRTALLETVARESAPISLNDREVTARVESWLVKLQGVYEGDFVSGELRAPEALHALLQRPAIYVRGALDAFSAAATIQAAAAVSGKDPFLLCLLDPPDSRAEKALLAKVRMAYAGAGALEQSTATVRRLYEAQAGLPLLAPEWAERVRSARDSVELTRLQKQFERAPIQRAKQAAKAQVLIAVMDEPNEAGGVTELDGEHAHPVRVGIVDLAERKILVRLRNRADPSWISETRRAEYARGLDSCLVALDVRKAL